MILIDLWLSDLFLRMKDWDGSTLIPRSPGARLPPATLNPECPCPLQHYVTYLNSMRVQDIYTSTHSLLHYFDRLILTGSDSKSNGDEGYGRSLRYAALNLAALHCRFAH